MLYEVITRNSQPFLPEGKHLSVLSYDAGIGFDPVYPTRRILTGMAEAAANGCSMVTKGTEYVITSYSIHYTKLYEGNNQFLQFVLNFRQVVSQRFR